MIQQHVSLRSLNTFGLDVEAKTFAEVKSSSGFNNLRSHPDFAENQWLVLGGGSNILFRSSPELPVVKVSIPGREVVDTAGDTVTVEVGAGENWHELVMWSLDQKLYGLENLSLIPGQAGAAPIQNIGAYGVELTSVFDSLSAYEIATGKSIRFTHEECQFGYRSSVFKKALKSRFIITSVRLKLSRIPNLMLDYGDVRAVLADFGITKPTPADVSRAVIHIRNSKLPNPAEIGNAGSFFKNPELGAREFEDLQSRFPNVPYHPVEGGRFKIPAGWLIDQLGWKGKRRGQAGVHERQALVLVNYGGAIGTDIESLASDIRQSVQNHYGVTLEAEVNII